MKRIPYLFLLIILIFKTGEIYAQWQTNGVPVCDTSANSGFYMLPQIATDGNGGAFACWRDGRSGNFDIYVQHIGSDGTMLWDKNGIPIVNDTNTQQFPRIISDGSGGAYIAWEDDRDGNTFVYAQRINFNGQNLWQNQGVKVSEKGGLFISIASDNWKSLLLAWVYGGVYDVIVQRMDSSGNRMWGDSGVQVTNRSGTVSANDVVVTSDNRGGAVVAWAEGDYPNNHVYVQRVDSLGNTRWQTNGILLSDSTTGAGSVAIAKDNEGGAIVIWVSNYYHFTQKVNSTGQKLWGPNGILLGYGSMGGGRRITSDGFGGAYIGYGNRITHMDSMGTKLWGTDGASFTILPSVYVNSSQVKNITGGIWNFWAQETTNSITSLDIYGQYIDNSGSILWETNGRPVCKITNVQDWPRATSDGAGHAVVVWDDFRNGYSSIYAAKVDTGGIITKVSNDNNSLPVSPTLNQNYPNPLNPETLISYSLPNSAFVTLSIFDIFGRNLTRLVEQKMPAGTYVVHLNAQQYSSGIYFYRLTADKFTITKKMVVLH